MEPLLAYPNFSRPFEIHTNTSNYQLGAVISKNKKPIAFYSFKLNAAQTRYTTTEKEILAMVKTLKEFKNILLGQDIKVFIDHKNLTYKTQNLARVMRWRLTIEEFGPELIYIPGNKNIVADALSRLHVNDTTDNSCKNGYFCAELLALSLDNFLPHTHPLNYKTIMRHQQQDKKILAAAQNDNSYVIKDFAAASQV